MGKALLVLNEKPESCSQCNIFNSYDLTCLGCKVSFKEVGKVQSWCPLKLLPNKIVHSETDDPFDEEFEDGWRYWEIEGYNECLKEILGEEK